MAPNHLLHQPLLVTTTTGAAVGCDTQEAAPPGFRGLLLLSFVAILAVWANHEASKGFDVSIVNAAGDTPLGRRFSALFLSTDEATRIVLRTSQLAEKILYSYYNTSHPKKQVDRITLRLVDRNSTRPEVFKYRNEYVIEVGAAVMRDRNAGEAMALAVQRGMARVWVWDGEGGAPEGLVEGMVEWVVVVAGFGKFSGQWPESVGGGCWIDEDCLAVAEFLNYCEGLKKGFIGRLNQAMRERWNERMVDDALGLPAQRICRSYYNSRNESVV